jgi:NAD(P)-dependent dehydrogenase (short-subunit alcohol dehydrogenase family)
MSGRACEGRVALVTGASKGGTGTAIARRLAAEGAAVVITARNEAGLERTRKDIADAGGRVEVVPCDLADPLGGREELVAATARVFGPVDILVNNAAAGGFRAFTEWSLDDLREMQEVNVWAPWRLCQQVLPGMRKRGRGWILNLTTSVAELPPGPPFPPTPPAQLGSAYGATKACLNRMTLALAAETEGEGIAVNALTPQAAIMTPELLRARAAGQMDPDFFEPLETMAEAALALCTVDPRRLHGRLAYSLQLLLELQRPVRDLAGGALLPEWQPEHLPAHIATQVAAHHRAGFRHDVYDFHRPSSPTP